MHTPATCRGLPLQVLREAVSNDSGLSQSLLTPVGPEEVIVQGTTTVGHEEHGGDCGWVFASLQWTPR